MSEKVSSSKKAKAATVEDFDEVKGEADPATRKSARSHRPANSASKRTSNKTPELHQGPSKSSRPVASDSGHSNHSRGSGKAKFSEGTTQPVPEDDLPSGRRPSIRKSSNRDTRPRIPEKKSSRDDSHRHSEKRTSRDIPSGSGRCGCLECMPAIQVQRPGPVPLQQGYHAFTHPHGPYPATTQAAPHPEQYPSGYVPLPRPRRGSLMAGGRPSSFHQGMLPGYHGPELYPSGRGYFDHAPPVQQSGVEAHAFDPRYQAPHAGMSPHLGRSSMAPPPRRQGSPVKLPSRPTLGHQGESYSARTSTQQFTPKISTYDPSSKKGFEEEYISAREAPARRLNIPGQYESSESPESSPERFLPTPPQPPRPSFPTMREPQRIQGGRDIAISDIPRSPLIDRNSVHRPDYHQSGSLDGGVHWRSDRHHEQLWDRHSDRDPREHHKYQEERRSSSRRDSIASGRTQQTSYSNPEQFMGGPGLGRRDSYVAYDQGNSYQQPRGEDGVKAYQDAWRGYPESEMNADTMAAAGGSHPSSNPSHRSHRSRPSVSESQYTRTGDGGIRLRVPQGSAIEFGDNMADRQIQVHSSAGPDGLVDIVVGGSNRDTRYYRSNISATHSAGPSRVSSGSTRHTTRGRDERDQTREGDRRERRLSRAPSSRH